MVFNSNSIGVENEYSLYLPTNFLNYKYAININNDYVDLINTPTISSSNQKYIRAFFDRPGLIVEKTLTDTSFVTSTQELNVTDDFFARSDSFSICGCTLILLILLVWVFNSVTELFNKGGLFQL